MTKPDSSGDGDSAAPSASGGDERFRALFEGIPVPTVLWSDDSQQILLANRAAEDLYGYTRDELSRMRVADLRAPSDLAEVLRRLTPVADDRTTHHRHKDGTVFPVDIDQRSLTLDGRRVTVCAVHDLRGREQLALTLRESEERYRSLFDSMPTACFVVEQGTGKILQVNEAAVKLYGFQREELTARTIFDLRANNETPKIADVREPSYGGAWRHRKQDKTEIDVELSVHPIALGGDNVLLVVANDVTMRKRLEEQLLHSQKMEAIGRLAGGIAHDFNNVLSAVLVGSECVMTDLGEQHALFEDVAHIRAAAMRAASLTHQLLAFSRQQFRQLKAVQLNTVVTDLEKMLRRLIGEDVRLTVSIDPSLGLVEADPGQITQVIMNLVVNARDAMPNGGTLTVSTRNDELDDAHAREIDLLPGSYVVLSVRDNGVGMSQATVEKIFDPFFTTKEQGKGTGLGLSTVFGIVKQSAGGIRVLTKPGQGATFEVYLPRVAEGRSRVTTHTPRGARLLRGSETVLLVEDDVNVRAMVRRTLKAHGYQVIDAGSGDAAIAACEERLLPIQLVLSDVVMPGLDGPATVAAVRARFPQVKVLYMSGYSEHPALRAAEATLLKKPFSVEELISAIRGALDEATT